jgi:hypothetical protein
LISSPMWGISGNALWDIIPFPSRLGTAMIKLYAFLYWC